MKKIIYVLLAILIAATSADARSRSKRSQHSRKQPTSVIPVTKGAVKQYGDYLTTRVYTAKNGKRGESKLSLEYPIDGNPQLVSAIREYIKAIMGREFTGSLNSPEALTRHILDGTTDLEYGDEFSNQLDAEIKIIYSTPEVITIQIEGSEYTGGLHPLYFIAGKTFLVEDATTFEVYMLPDIETLRPDILSRMTEYWECTREELGDYLYSPLVIEYPDNVMLTEKGIRFVYQPYEIGPWSSGAPEATIPATGMIISFLSPEGQRFFE